MFSLNTCGLNLQEIKKKKSRTVHDEFIDTVNESNCKPNKLCVYQRRKFYNKSMQEWLDNNDILMHSTHNQGKSLIT